MADTKTPAEQEAELRAKANNAPAQTATAAPADDDNKEYIWVVSNLSKNKDGGHPLALFEQNDDHPTGEAFVSGDTAVQVGMTSAVMEKLNKKVIRKANAPEISKAKKAEKELAEQED